MYFIYGLFYIGCDGSEFDAGFVIIVTFTA